MTSITPSQKELPQHTTPSESPVIRFGFSPVPANVGGAIVLRMERRVVHAPLPDHYTEIDDVVREYERDPLKSQALARARSRLATPSMIDSAVTLSTLRLQQGLSQAALAGLIGNSQPSYSKIEAGRVDVLLSTFEKLKVALNVSRDELAMAIANTAAENE